ncbi:MAG: hypothetical protein H6R18_1183 [Proteobacteria bacterium]|nr:hypothetical protein [Pseudomonadota bacterium]
MATPKEIIELVQSSGNNFHAKVARWLTANGWHVVVSPYYMDQTQNKAREIDLIAEKAWPLHDSFGSLVGDIAVRLFVECKFVASDTVFWFADKDRDSAMKLVCSSSHFRDNNIYTEKHHYLSQSPRVAKLFSTDNKKAQESDPFYKALNQVLNAMVSMRGLPVSIPELKKWKWQPSVIEFPIVMCSSFDKIYSVDFCSESEPQPVQDNFQLEVRYAYLDKFKDQRDDFFLLDIVAFDKLAAFAKAIEEDVEIAKFLMSDN